MNLIQRNMSEWEDESGDSWSSLAFCFQMFLIGMAGSAIGANFHSDVFSNVCMVVAAIYGGGGSIIAFMWRRAMGNAQLVRPERCMPIKDRINGARSRAQDLAAGARNLIRGRLPEWRNLRDAVTRSTLLDFAIVSAAVIGIAVGLLLGITTIAYALYLIT